MAFTSSAVPLQLTGCTAGASQLLPYCFTINLQGDILAILDSAGNTVVQYAYDAWGGKKTTTGSMAGTLGYYNPFRYRGYVWDEETWMYYLRSRYYYPELQRFISADNLLGAKGRLFSHNTYAYGSNTPVISKDMDGNESEVAYPPLAGNEFGKMTLGPISKMTNLEFIAHLRQMADEKWKYEYGYVQFKAVDCVGAYRYIMKWYYKEKSYGRLFNIMDSKTKKMRSLTTVSQLVSKGTYGVKLIENYDDLSIGMAVFRKGVSKWEHVGYYIGKTEQYGHTIIEARDEQSGVIYSSLIGSSFTHYGELTGIEYR